MSLRPRPPAARVSSPASNAAAPSNVAGADTRTPKGWHHRGYLPHFDDQSQIQTITYRLADSLPQEILQRLSTELDNTEGDLAYRQRIETCLDSGYGGCCLKQPATAQIVINSWLKFHTIRYDLFEWVVMPNHVHILLVPHEGFAIAEIVKGFKSYTARQINKIIGNNGQLWQEDYWDRYIRNSRHFNAAAAYIRENPVKAGLTDKPESWPWSSAGTPPPGSG